MADDKLSMVGSLRRSLRVANLKAKVTATPNGATRDDDDDDEVPDQEEDAHALENNDDHTFMEEDDDDQDVRPPAATRTKTVRRTRKPKSGVTNCIHLFLES